MTPSEDKEECNSIHNDSNNACEENDFNRLPSLSSATRLNGESFLKPLS